MQWSRYNHLLRLQETGGFLYNSLSNTLFELDDSHYPLIKGWKKNPDNFHPEDTEFPRLLKKKVLIESDEEKNLLLACRWDVDIL